MSSSPHEPSSASSDEAPVVPAWLRHYNRVISRKPAPRAYVGPSACSVCCTFFSIFGAMFLFAIASLMRSKYRYIHIQPTAEADLPELSRSVTYAAFLYLLCGLYSMAYWVKGNVAKRDALLAEQGH